ncbi:outer membrane protein transport protein [Vibrio paracholerae]|uniref:outer membrane protein transport protein n=1 Tax=Vibrio paracholerae TaxID=650003 RepID=UPI0020940EFF|nr:outer membrane protein transport protein [Vibrio paracholerae]MCO7065483.1 outer membrane protein transport protein [Vibrio paracholerae]
MNNMRLFKKSLLAVTVTLATQQAFAAGFQLNAQSATGLGRAFAGDAVIADNAAVMSRNPAAMALFDEMALSLGFETITTDIKVKNATYTSPTGQKNANYDDAGGTSVAPNIHLIVPVNEQFAWGVNAYSNFGTRTEFEKNYVASEYGGETEILSVNLGVSGSYRIDNQWSVGAGLDLIYGQGTLKRAFSDTFYTGPVTTNPTTGMLKALNGRSVVDISKADGFGIGFNVGTVYELDENNRFGLSYRYSPTITAKDGDKEVKLPLPDLAEFSGYHRIENTAFAVHYSIQYIGWSAFDKLEFKNQSINEKPYQWQDGWHYSIGGTYYLNRDWTLRAGYMYDTSAQDKITSISVPDSDRQWLSAGFTYHIDDKSNIDLGLTYLMGKDVKVNEQTKNPLNPSTNLSSISGTTHADAILFGLQYSRTF